MHLGRKDGVDDVLRLGSSEVGVKRTPRDESGNDARLAPVPLQADLGQQTRDLGIDDCGRGDDVLHAG